MDWQQLRRKLEMDEAEENFERAVVRLEEAQDRLEAFMTFGREHLEKLCEIRRRYNEDTALE